MYSHYVPNEFPTCFSSFKDVSNNFYPILFFSFGVEGNGGFFFLGLIFSHYVPINVALPKQQENKTIAEPMN
jgi:hypothetical protein